jgi:dTDP-4-dehydrorhamnose reductase
MKVLITGASGKLGSELANHLASEGIHVTTLGRRALNRRFENYPWSLGMSPKPEAFIGVDCLIHLAWSTKDRGLLDFHLNVGGSSKLLEMSNAMGVKVINVSSLSTLNPTSMYGKAKEFVEQSNSNGINLRVAKIENTDQFKNLNYMYKLFRKFSIIPVPGDLSVQVMEMDKVLEEINTCVVENLNPGVYTLPYESYSLGEYLAKYYGLKSFCIPIALVNYFFIACNFSRSRKGKLLYDRWISLFSTDRALRQKS